MKNNQLGFDLGTTPAKEKAPLSDENIQANVKTKPAAKTTTKSADKTSDKEPNVFSVSQLNRLIRGQIEGNFPQIWVKGEISNFIAHTSGHYYFSLKDEGSQISAVMFRGFNSKLKFRPESGLEVMVKGKISVYEPRGSYQVFCEWMEPVGAGALQKAFEQLKAKLEKEGLFDFARKRPLPSFPKHIGVVTSRTGAAIQDILNVLRRRYKAARITLIPTLVQGPGAAAQIVNAIQMANQLTDLDVLIVGRGGGSIEDLWPFNEEPVARAIAASRIPTISAVGHEVDFTIADFVADLRAPTPSAAAELVVKNAGDLVDRLKNDSQRLVRAIQLKFTQTSDKLRSLQKQLVDPRRRLQDLIIRCDELSGRLSQSMLRYLNDCGTRVDLARRRMGSPQSLVLALSQRASLATQSLRNEIMKMLQSKKLNLREDMAKLEALSPLKVVERGYSIVTNESTKKIIKNAADLKKGDRLQLKFAKGIAEAEVLTAKLDTKN